MNKQYVKEQIEIAMRELRKEYDEKLAAIYQCQDCGAVTLKGTDHICLQGKIQPEVAKPKRKTVSDYVISVLPIEPPTEDIIEESSCYTAKGIAANVAQSGFSGSLASVPVTISGMVKQKKILRKAAILKVTSTKGDTKFEKEVSGFVYWRAT